MFPFPTKEGSFMQSAAVKNRHTSFPFFLHFNSTLCEPVDTVDSSPEVVSSPIPVYNLPIVREPSQHKIEVVWITSSNIHDIFHSANISGSTHDHINAYTSVIDEKIWYVPQGSALVQKQS